MRKHKTISLERGINNLALPASSIILGIVSKFEEPALCISFNESDENDTTINVILEVVIEKYDTGEYECDLTDAGYLKYLGTVSTHNGNIIHHVYANG